MPGSGQLPPYLAGREAEQALLQRYLETLRAGGTVPCDIVLTGPRGNGQDRAVAMVRASNRSRSATGRCRLADTGRHPGSGRARHGAGAAGPLRITAAGYGEPLHRVRGGGVAASRTERIVDPAAGPRAARGARWRCCSTEAQNLGEALGRALLNASQSVRRSGAVPVGSGRHSQSGRPLQRDGRRRSGTGRSISASVDSMPRPAPMLWSDPMESQGARMSPDALDSVVAESQHYPYFIQIWGESLWRKTREARTSVIDADVVADARPHFESRKTKYYSNRYVELSETGLLPAAVAVAGAFRGGALNGRPGCNERLTKLDRRCVSTIREPSHSDCVNRATSGGGRGKSTGSPASPV